MNLLKEKGYEFIFKPHPELVKYLELISVNDYVKISSSESFSDLFKDSSLLITDYSSILFDYAYMRKPQVLYQFDIDEFYGKHYKRSYFDHGRDGFGDVVTSLDGVISSIDKEGNWVVENTTLTDKQIDEINQTQFGIIKTKIGFLANNYLYFETLRGNTKRMIPIDINHEDARVLLLICIITSAVGAFLSFFLSVKERKNEITYENVEENYEVELISLYSNPVFNTICFNL